MSTVTPDYLISHSFEKTGLEPYSDSFPKISGRFSKNQISSLPPSDERKMYDLKIMLDRILYEKKLTNAAFESRTNIKMNSFRKSLNDGIGRRINRVTLAKFVIGLGLNRKEADQLFALESQPLDPDRVLLDAVVVHCIENKHDINEFFETCKQTKLAVKATE